jgi:uncharacterized membrane protein
MKEKFRSYSFWISVTGAVILVLNNLGKAFGFSVDNESILSIIESICGVLVVFGILTMPKGDSSTDIAEDNSTSVADTSAQSGTNNDLSAKSEALNDVASAKSEALNDVASTKSETASCDVSTSSETSGDDTSNAQNKTEV